MKLSHSLLNFLVQGVDRSVTINLIGTIRLFSNDSLGKNDRVRKNSRLTGPGAGLNIDYNILNEFTNPHKSRSSSPSILSDILRTGRPVQVDNLEDQDNSKNESLKNPLVDSLLKSDTSISANNNTSNTSISTNNNSDSTPNLVSLPMEENTKLQSNNQTDKKSSLPLKKSLEIIQSESLEMAQSESLLKSIVFEKIENKENDKKFKLFKKYESPYKKSEILKSNAIINQSLSQKQKDVRLDPDLNHCFSDGIVGLRRILLSKRLFNDDYNYPDQRSLYTCQNREIIDDYDKNPFVVSKTDDPTRLQLLERAKVYLRCNYKLNPLEKRVILAYINNGVYPTKEDISEKSMEWRDIKYEKSISNFIQENEQRANNAVKIFYNNLSKHNSVDKGSNIYSD